MKKLIFLVLALASTRSLRAQDNIAYVSLGPSFPVGDFQNAGGAKTGATFDLSFTHKLKGKKTGLTALLRRQSYSFKEQSATASASDWSMSSALLGATWILSIGDKIYFQPKILVGFTAALSPSVVYSGSTSVAISSSSGTAFSDLFGVMFRYDAWKKMSLFITADYFETDPKFTLTASSGKQVQSYNTDQKMNSINICAGLGYRF